MNKKVFHTYFDVCTEWSYDSQNGKGWCQNKMNTFFHVRLVRERAVVVVALFRACFGKTASKATYKDALGVMLKKHRDDISTMRRAARIASPVERAYTTRG